MDHPALSAPASTPSVEDGGPIVLYDGVCGLCNRSVQFILRHDRAGRFRFAALQSDFARGLLRRHGLPEDQLESVVLVRDGRAYRRSAAALGIARGLDAPWPLLGALGRVVPRFVADFVYDRVASSRYRVFGKLDACMLPPPEVRSRFLG